MTESAPAAEKQELVVVLVVGEREGEDEDHDGEAGWRCAHHRRNSALVSLCQIPPGESRPTWVRL